MRIQRLTGRCQLRMGERIVLAIEAEQTRHVDNPLVHLPSLGLPGHLFEEILEEAIGTAQPAGQQVNPGTATESLACDHASKRTERRLLCVREFEEGCLNNARHALTLPHIRLWVRISWSLRRLTRCG